MIAKSELWLVRHGIVPPKTGPVAQDYARTLTPQGRKQAKRAGKLLHKIAPHFDAVYSSPMPRCVQTAELITPKVAGGAAQLRPFLHDTLNTQPRRLLELAKDDAAVLVVGHGPEFQAAIKALTGKRVWLARGAVCQLVIRDGQASVGKLVQPADVKRMIRS